MVHIVGRTWLSADGLAGVEMAGGGWAEGGRGWKKIAGRVLLRKMDSLSR